DAADRVWWVRHLECAEFLTGNGSMAADGRSVCSREPSRRRRVRRGMASRRNKITKAKCVRRFHRGSGMADREQIYFDAKARDNGAKQWRLAGWGCADSAT